MEKITKVVYATEDGEEFGTEVEAAAHERAMAIEVAITVFMETVKTPNQRKRTEIERVIRDWENWRGLAEGG